MSTIKGLVIKDLLQLKKYKRSLIMYLVIFSFIAMNQESEIRYMLGTMITLFFGMFSIASFSYDEMSKADRYILTLPITRKDVVLSKYILVIGSTVIGSIIGVILSLVITLIINKQVTDIGELVIFALSGIFGIGLVESLQIPCIYKYGAEKGRLQIFIIIILIAFVIGAIVGIGERLGINLPLDNLSNIINNYLPIILIVATAIIYGISYTISYRIYSKKEM